MHVVPTRLSLLIGLLLIAGGAQASETGEYDVWHVAKSGKTAYHASHTTRQRQPDGTLKLRTESRLLVDFLGQKQEHRETLECVVNDALEPLTCELQSSGQSGAAKVSGKVEGGEFVMQLTRGSLHVERRVSLADRPIFGATLGDWLAAHRDLEGTRELTLIDCGKGSSKKATLRRLPDEMGLARFEVTSPDAVESSICWLAADGALDRVEYPNTGATVRRATAEVDQQLEYLTIADRALLVFAAGRDLPFPERARSIDVKLVWKGDTPKQLRLEDARQHVTRQTHEGDRHEVELRLEQPVAIASPAPLPVTDPELARFLGQDDFIRPQDPGIARQAREWAGDATTTLEAVRRLTHEVSGFLQGGELIVETLSGPEVLACRKGKCSEFTTLLASLTRSVGVPTRVALGMRMSGGRWMGHMWCETWVGQWIPVDATADEVGGSPALLKLTDSDTVMGTQEVRHAMTKLSEVTITDVVAGEPKVANLTTGVVRQTYTNADFACRITAPDESWTLSDQSKPGTPMIRFQPPGSFEGREPQVHLVAFALPANIDAPTLINIRKQRTIAASKGFEELSNQPQPVGGLAGQRIVFRLDDKKAKQKIKTTEVVWIGAGSGFLLNLIAEESVHDALLPQFERLLGSFEILLPEAAAEVKP